MSTSAPAHTFRRRALRTSALAVGAFALAAALVDARADDAPPFSVQSLKQIRERAVVMQRWENSCAAAALATVLTYGFQDPVSERHLAIEMLKETDPGRVRARGGFSLLDMKRAVEERGFKGDAYQYLSLQDLRLFHAPIVPIRVHGFNHYVVLRGVVDGKVLLADPAFGNRSMSLKRFEKAWLHGLAFVVTPASDSSR